jgi:predicted DNA-binding transcriptional regulator YafY
MDPIGPGNNRWELLVRYRFIEIIALWEGRLTTRHLCDTFGIGRQQASKDINNYKRSIGPGNLDYDKFAKGYVPSPSFTPKVSRGEADEYLQLVARASELQQTLADLAHAGANRVVLAPPKRQVPAEVLRPLIIAARECRRVEVDYVSLNHPDREGRIIVPHTLVWTGQRWHVRGWCEKNQDYRDFVLSRFRGEADIMDLSEHGVDGDTSWQQFVTLRITPDPRLSEEQQAVVAHDHDMTSGCLEITVRSRLVAYLLKLMNLREDAQSRPPESQQIVLANAAEVAPWLLD